jgi:hypothetical protein
MTESFVLQIFDCPKSMNQGGAGYKRHWRAAHQEKKLWEGWFGTELMAARIPRGMARCRVSVTIQFKEKRRRDAANYFAPVTKPLYDALVHGGYLPDDTDEFVTMVGFRLEHLRPWPHNPFLKQCLVIRLEADYDAAAQA